MMGYFSAILLVGLWLVTADITSKSTYSGLSGFEWASCNGPLPAEVANLSVTPDPIVLPGIAIFYLDIVSSVNITAPAQLDVVIEKQVGESWVEIPCINGKYGTCTSPDFCQTLQNHFGLPDQPCPHDSQCRCPFDEGVFSLELVIPLNFDPPAEIVDGNYHVHIGMNNSAIGQLFCVDVNATLFVQVNTTLLLQEQE